MLVTKITDHVQQALDRLMQQYRNRPIVTLVFTALVNQIQDIENAMYDLNDGLMLYNGTTNPAVGAQLDGIGDIVGIKRNGLPDPEYLIFIIGKIAENFSDDTLAAVANVAFTLFRPAQILPREMFPAEMSFEVSTSAVDPTFYPIISGLIQASMGAGIGLGFISMFPTANGFTCGSDEAYPPAASPTEGFSNDDGAGNPSGPGGLFAGDIYVNSAA